jgi:hypothetical protein
MKKHTLADAPSNCVNKIGHFAIKIVDHTHERGNKREMRWFLFGVNVNSILRLE